MKKISFKPIALVTFNADRDWKRLFFLFVAVAVVVIVWSGYIFWGVDTGQALSVSALEGTPQEASSTLNTADMSAIQTLYAAKAVKFQNALTASPATVDPSL